MKYLLLLASLNFCLPVYVADFSDVERSGVEKAPETTLRIVVISDTHTRHRELELPAGDILIHAGDFTNYGKRIDITKFNNWLGELAFKKIFVVAGNHEHPQIIREKLSKLLTNATFLHGDRVDYRGIKIYGLGWSFNNERWAWPQGTDIVITHQAPVGVMGGTEGQPGCIEISKAIVAKPPLLHIFGHHHSLYGIQEIEVKPEKNVMFVNAGMESYPKMHKPFVFEVRLVNDAVVGIRNVTN